MQQDMEFTTKRYRDMHQVELYVTAGVSETFPCSFGNNIYVVEILEVSRSSITTYKKRIVRPES